MKIFDESLNLLKRSWTFKTAKIVEPKIVIFYNYNGIRAVHPLPMVCMKIIQTRHFKEITLTCYQP